MTKSVRYEAYLLDTLKNPQEAAGYLNAALEGGDVRVFLSALRHVVQAQGGVTMLAKKTAKSRTSLYKALSVRGNPYLKSTNEILSAMKMHLEIVANGNET